MACKYYLEGHEFNSEVLLNDFLQECYRYKSELGDIVFLIGNGPQLNALNIIKNITIEADKATSAKRERVWDDDGKTWKYQLPYIGVNLFLKDYTNPLTGAKLFPVVILDNYWYGVDRHSGRVAEWAKGNYTDDEKELFFPDGNVQKIIDNQEFYINKMESKWEALCLYGDAIHSVLLLFFTEQEGKYIGDRYNEGTLTFDDLKNELSKNTYLKKDNSSISFVELLDDPKIKETIQLAWQLMTLLREKYGQSAIFFPEFKISGKIELGSSKTNTLLGYIDLLVIDKDGNPLVIDYKTSPKHYDYYKKVKKYTYTYLLATYGKLLGKASFNIDKTDYLVVPILLAGFKETNENQFTFSIPKFKSPDGSNIFADISADVKTDESINRNLSDIIHLPFITEVSTDHCQENVQKLMEAYFKGYSLFKNYTDKEIAEQLGDLSKLKNEETGKFEWRPLGGKSSHIITSDSEEGLLKEVKEYKNNMKQYRSSLVNQVKKGLKEAIKAGSTSGITFAKKQLGNIQVNPEWFETQMEKYCNDSWKVMDAKCFDILDSFGIIAVSNGQLYDFIRLSTSNLKYQHKFGKNTTLMGGIGKSDLDYASRVESLALPAITGNIELIETMCVINLLKNIFGSNAIVGKLQVYDPIHNFGLSASNEELLYNFNQLTQQYPIDGIENNFKEDGIYMANKVTLAYQQFKDIMSREAISWAKGEQFTSCLSLLDTAIQGKDRDIQLQELQNLLKVLESSEVDINQKLKNATVNLTDLMDDMRSLHNSVIMAIAELKGINFRQLIEDHEKICDSVNILKNGLSGSSIDNPGNQKSETLNTITKLVTQAWQNLRTGIQDPASKIQNATRKFIKESNTKNIHDLYSSLYNITEDDILFKNPWTDKSLTESQKEYLKFAIILINKRRNGVDLSLNNVEVNSIKKGYDSLYFRVPLKLGNSKAFTDQESLLKAFKNKISSFRPKEGAKKIVNDLMNGESYLDDSKTNLFELINTFSLGDSAQNRLKYIAANGIKAFESDLESILLSYEFAYLLKEAIDEVFPLIKASYIHLAEQGAEQNTLFSKDIQYLEEYIRNKIKNESIITPKFRSLNSFLGKLRGASSKLVLAFSPVQMFYQTIQGIWNDISLVIRKPDGTDTFNKLNMVDGAKEAYKDLFHFGNTPTVGSMLNRLYGLNDMDINIYSERLKVNQNRWENWMMKWASRPDYYNRLTIFYSKMIHDGCYKAHHLDENYNLVYNCKEDERYKAFLLNPNGKSKEVLKAKALYIAAARQFEVENTKMPDGTLFKLNLEKLMDLPRAYTTLEAESVKDLSDTIYGYYSSEKKSLIHSTILGSMWMQFRTYWSGKKNLYLASGGVRLQGKWVLAKNNEGLLLYYLLDEKGNVLSNLPPTNIDTGIPFYQWEGDWKEGILLTLTNFISNTVNDGLKSSIHDLWYNEDARLRQAYRSNIKQFIYDFIMFAIVGTFFCNSLRNWKDDLEKSSEKDDILDGFKLSMANIAVKSVQNSFLDFNFFDSVMDPTISWSPFAFTYLTSQAKNVWDSTVGDGHLLTGIANMSSATRYFKPAFKAVLYNIQ